MIGWYINWQFPPVAPPPPANSQGDDVAVRPGPSIQLAGVSSAWVDGRDLPSARNEVASFDYRELAAWSLVGALIRFAAFLVWFIYILFDFGLLNLLES